MFKLVEKFKSIQSEGYHAGTPATFLRLFSCNLACKFGSEFQCDESLHTNKDAIEIMSIEEIVEYCRGIYHVVITGGEPSLQDLTELIKELQVKHYVQVETNGHNIGNISRADWITYSPKFMFDSKAAMLYGGYNELKLLGSEDFVPDTNLWRDVLHKYLQPIGNEDSWNMENVRWAANWVVENPTWKLSLQAHKIYGGR